MSLVQRFVLGHGSMVLGTLSTLFQHGTLKDAFSDTLGLLTASLASIPNLEDMPSSPLPLLLRKTLSPPPHASTHAQRKALFFLNTQLKQFFL